jgi:hypothetical protein
MWAFRATPETLDDGQQTAISGGSACVGANRVLIRAVFHQKTHIHALAPVSGNALCE